MSIVEFLSQPLWQRLGLTLVHFLWQGLAVAVLASAFVKVFRLKHGNARYAAYLLAFIAMIVCPVVTFTAIDITISPNTELVTRAESTEVIDSSPYTALSADDILPEAETPRPAILTLADSIPLGQRISDWLNVSMPWILVIWMVGVIVLSVRLLMGFVGVYRWRHHLEPLPERLAQRIASLSEGLGMRGFSGVFISPTVLQAMSVGYLRPMVLLPAAMVTQMQPEMLEAVIAHELAHIRRFDLWINLAQRVTETLLFYHPAVWWLSICLRSERELCCDELAVKATGRRLTYATTLESVGRARFMAKQPVLAAGLGQDNKPTLSRVRHILGLAPSQRNCPFWLAGVITVLFLAALVIPTTLALTNQSDEKLNDFERVVVEGIRANRDKFKCGYLAWSSKQITTRFADSNRPATELAGEYELWWDGNKKIATKYVRDMVYKDPEGRYRVEEQQGGTSYDGGVLSRKPDFHSDNWLGPEVTRWRGRGSRDWLIRQDSKQRRISQDWSVVDNNGAKLIRVMHRNMNEKSIDYGAHSITDYDPSKGYGLVNEEWYNPDGSPRLKHTVKMVEVIPGGWFPVEVDFKSFTITDGKVYSHNHYALDIERCSFNDKSALPDRVFKGAVDKQLKYQEKLQKYLAMELEGISDVKEAAKADKVKRGAREAIEKFVAAAMAGDFEKARQFADPDKAPYDQVADIPEVLKGQNLWIMAVVADDFDAIGVSSVILGDHERIGPLVFFLDRKPQDGRDNWWVDDIDMETPDGAEVELKQFLEKHPKAQKVPYENKPDVQVEKVKRALHFPDMFSVGTVYIRDPITDDWYKNWEKIGEANGEISVPARKKVKLVISESAVGDLSFLSELGANDIQMLSFGWKAITLGSLAPIGNLKGLKALNLQSTRFEYDDLKYLTKLGELEILRLGDYELTDESMRYIGELTSLRSLALWGTGISEEGLIHLQNLKNLTFLALNSCDITDSGLSYLKNMTNLEGLQLTKTGITGNGLSSLSHLTKLKSLLIGHNNITDAGLEKLQSFTLLENLWINNTLITDDGLAYLSDMKNLKELYASNTKISDAGLVHLKGLKDFWHLSITGIGDEGISHLSELPSLKHLQIHDAQVTKASIPYFQKMESIEKVLLSGDKINDDLLDALRAALPACKIWDPQRSRDYPMRAWSGRFVPPESEATYPLTVRAGFSGS